jgi:hypothetical protein
MKAILSSLPDFLVRLRFKVVTGGAVLLTATGSEYTANRLESL